MNEWLSQQQGSVSKADIQKYLKDNRIQVVEVVLGKDDYRNLPEYKEADQKAFEAASAKMEAQQRWWESKKEEDFDEIQRLDKELEKWTRIKQGIEKRKEQEGVTKFSQYQLEGDKSNYKEVLVTMPKKYSEKERSDAEDRGIMLPTNNEKNVFSSSHFSEPNILVHLRMNTRTDSDGNKVLFLEEVQSDWGQKGKKDGFVEKIDKNNIQNVREDENVWVVKFDDGSFLDISKKEAKNADEAKVLALQSKKERFVSRDSKTPTAPFVTDTNAWTKLGLKVALKEAVAQGAERIAWSTGEQQFDRWGSEEIHWRKNTERTPQENKRMKELGEKIINYKDTPEERVEHEKLARKEAELIEAAKKAEREAYAQQAAMGSSIVEEDDEDDGNWDSYDILPTMI